MSWVQGVFAGNTRRLLSTATRAPISGFQELGEGQLALRGMEWGRQAFRQTSQCVEDKGDAERMPKQREQLAQGSRKSAGFQYRKRLAKPGPLSVDMEIDT